MIGLKELVEKAVFKCMYKNKLDCLDKESVDLLVSSISSELIDSGITFGVLHSDFRSCAKCLTFNEAPHHEKCLSCRGFSNFESAFEICPECGNSIKGDIRNE